LISLPLMFVLLTLFFFTIFGGFIMAPNGNESLVITAFGILLIASLTIVIPSIALQVRRLHDIGKSGFWYFITLIPFGGIILLVMSALPGQSGTNAYGPNIYEVLASVPQTPPPTVE
jgi:uncharacterized membrane protein YhaH (DUF805 family)